MLGAPLVCHYLRVLTHGMKTLLLWRHLLLWLRFSVTLLLISLIYTISYDQGNPIYVRYFDATVIDWVTHNPCPNALANGQPCVPQGLPGQPCSWDNPSPQVCNTGTMESPWRSLEMWIRTDGPFAAAFFGFQNAAEFSTSARILLILVLDALPATFTAWGVGPERGVIVP